MVVAAWQTPLPSQVRPVVSVGLPVAQTGEVQEVPAAKRRQAPLPLQNPSVPQVALPASWQVPWGSVAPAATLVQVPSDLVSAQDWQAPWQAVAQQID